MAFNACASTQGDLVERFEKLLFNVTTSFSVNYDLEAAGGTSFSGDLGFGNRIGSRAALLKKFLSGLRVGIVAVPRASTDY